MRRTRHVILPALSDLFAPRPNRPLWEQLPVPVRHDALALLAELLRGRRRPQPLRARRKGASNE
jgi:hypothetical protein